MLNWRKVFPSNLHSKALGVIRTLIEVQGKSNFIDLKKRYFLKPDESYFIGRRNKNCCQQPVGNIISKIS